MSSPDRVCVGMLSAAIKNCIRKSADLREIEIVNIDYLEVKLVQVKIKIFLFNRVKLSLLCSGVRTKNSKSYNDTINNRDKSSNLKFSVYHDTYSYVDIISNQFYPNKNTQKLD